MPGALGSKRAVHGALMLSQYQHVLVSNFPLVLNLTKKRTCLGYRARKIFQTIAFGSQRSHQLRVQESEHLGCGFSLMIL